MTCGVYKIVHRDSGKTYIGSSKNIEWRWEEHRYLLDRGSHPTPHLQSAWDKYGSESFVFEIYDVCEEGERLEREQYHLDLDFSSGMLYNTNPIAGRPPGQKRGGKRSPETIQKIKDSWVGREVRSGRIGQKHSEESRQKMSQSRRGRRLSEEHRQKISNSVKRTLAERRLSNERLSSS